LGALDELERSSKAEAEQRLEIASREAARRLEIATEQSERKIANARDLTEELRVLRGRILSQLDGVRGQLEAVPSMLAAVTREGELLDRDRDASTTDGDTDATTEIATEESEKEPATKELPATAGTSEDSDRKSGPGEQGKRSGNEAPATDRLGRSPAVASKVRN
ncbi:MAG: hypothetical protein LPK27_01210, partial [Rhodococcus sp. (in: high G+C Gram-positive bacteria)]|nr:hypothetical protein [Rhodococcus sp. (in: high G+C Gram-positive bacteria)]